MTVSQNIKAALLAGLAAGAILALYSLVITSPLIDQAIELEQGKAGAVEEAFSRAWMKLGHVSGSILQGVFLGIVFGVVFGLMSGLVPGGNDTRKVIAMALAGYWTFTLFPFLKYPATPPGVGGVEDISFRQVTYLVFLGLALATTVVSVALFKKQESGRRGFPFPAVTVIVLLSAAIYFFMPAHPPPPVDMPSSLLWGFRAASLVGLTLLWLAMASGFIFFRRRLAR